MTTHIATVDTISDFVKEQGDISAQTTANINESKQARPCSCNFNKEFKSIVHLILIVNVDIVQSDSNYLEYFFPVLKICADKDIPLS